MRTGVTVTLALISLAFVEIAAHSAEIRVSSNATGSYRALIIEGLIEKGDYEKLIKLVRDNQGKISDVWIFTPGGDFMEAIKIGRALRALELSSMVPMQDEKGRPYCDGQLGTPTPKDPKNATCASAGFFIHIGSVHRGGTYLAVHRPTFEADQLAKLSEVDAKKALDSLQSMAREYMEEMGVPKQIQEDVMTTPSNQVLVLDEKTVRKYIWGYLPARHEWLRAKCDRLSREEAAKLDSLRTKFLKAGDLANDEMKEYLRLEKLEDEERKARGALVQASRLNAFEKFFGSKPSDSANHDFKKWSGAASYLGRSFDDIVAEERFEEKKQTVFGKVHWNVLTRNATAKSPCVTIHDALSDSKSNIRVVVSVTVLSPSDPSKEFIEILLKSLDGSWGDHRVDGDQNEMVWEQNQFTARLRNMGKSPDGVFWLDIDAKSK